MMGKRDFCRNRTAISSLTRLYTQKIAIATIIKYCYQWVLQEVVTRIQVVNSIQQEVVIWIPRKVAPLALQFYGYTNQAQKATNSDSARRETAGADTIDRHSLTECRTATFDHQQ